MMDARQCPDCAYWTIDGGGLCRACLMLAGLTILAPLLVPSSEFLVPPGSGLMLSDGLAGAVPLPSSSTRSVPSDPRVGGAIGHAPGSAGGSAR